MLSIADDANGYLWLATRNGLSRMHKKTGKCVRFFTDTTTNHNQLQNVGIDKEGMVWVSHGSGVYKFDSRKKYNSTTVQIKASDRMMNQAAGDICIFHDGTVAVQTSFGAQLFSNGGVKKLDVEGFSEVGKPLGDAMMQDREGTLWVGTLNGLFYAKQGATSLKPFVLFEGEQPECNSMAEAENGELWIGTTQGLYIIHSNGSVSHVTNNPQNELSLSYNLIHSIYKDRSGLMWVGTANKGLNLYDASRNQFKVLNNNTTNGALKR